MVKINKLLSLIFTLFILSIIIIPFIDISNQNKTVIFCKENYPEDYDLFSCQKRDNLISCCKDCKIINVTKKCLEYNKWGDCTDFVYVPRGNENG